MPPIASKRISSMPSDMKDSFPDTIARPISTIVLLSLLSPEGFYNETSTELTELNCNELYCSVAIWNLMLVPWMALPDRGEA